MVNTVAHHHFFIAIDKRVVTELNGIVGGGNPNQLTNASAHSRGLFENNYTHRTCDLKA